VQRSGAGSLPNLIHQWRALDPQLHAAAARAMIDHAKAIKLRGLAEKPWLQELEAYLGANESTGGRP